MEFSQPEWDRGDSVPGASKLDHLQPVKPILFWNFSNFWLSYWGVPIPYYPRKMRKWNSPNLSKTEGFECKGHSNWTICNHLSQFCSEIFPTFDFHTGECQFLITPGNGILPTWVRHRGLGAWGIQTGPFAALWANFVQNIFQISQLHHLHTGDANSYYPRVREAENKKKGLTQKLIRPKGFSAWGIQTGPFAAY